MEKRLIHWSKKKYILSVLGLLAVSALFVYSYKRIKPDFWIDRYYLYFLACGTIYQIFSIIKKIFMPELEFSESTLRFYNLGSSKRIKIHPNKIQEITEYIDGFGTEKVHKSAFKIKARDGKDYEYLSGGVSEKRINEIRKFFRDLPGLPEFKQVLPGAV